MSSPETQSPVNAVPPLVVALFLIIVALEAMFSLGARGMVGGPEAIGWRSYAIQTYGFSNRAMAWMMENQILRPDYLVRFVSYPFVHASFTHALFAGVMTLALGKFVGERMPQWAVLALFFGSSVLGALAYGLIQPDAPGLIGAFPGIYGLIGGFTFLMWLRLGEIGAQQARAFSLIGVLLGLQLIFGLLFGAGTTWIADVSGFVFGFGLSFVLVPGGFGKLREKIRHE